MSSMKLMFFAYLGVICLGFVYFFTMAARHA